MNFKNRYLRKGRLIDFSESHVLENQILAVEPLALAGKQGRENISFLLLTFSKRLVQ